MDELNASIEGLGAVVDELIALLPEEPATELDAKAAELVGRVVEHLALIDAMPDEPAEEEGDDMAEDTAEVADVEA